MLGSSVNVTIFSLMWCVIVCSLVVCSAECASPDTHDFLRRFYRAVGTADTSVHKTVQLPDAPVKQSPDDKKSKDVKEVSPPSNVSVTDNVTTKVELHVPVGGTQHNLNQGALLRGFYVFVGLSAIVVIYIVVRAISMRRKKTTVRKYGILTNREDVEMTPLGAEDDEEDTTLFDVSNQTRP